MWTQMELANGGAVPAPRFLTIRSTDRIPANAQVGQHQRQERVQFALMNVSAYSYWI